MGFSCPASKSGAPSPLEATVILVLEDGNRALVAAKRRVDHSDIFVGAVVSTAAQNACHYTLLPADGGTSKVRVDDGVRSIERQAATDRIVPQYKQLVLTKLSATTIRSERLALPLTLPLVIDTAFVTVNGNTWLVKSPAAGVCPAGMLFWKITIEPFVHKTAISSLTPLLPGTCRRPRPRGYPRRAARARSGSAACWKMQR